MDTEYLPYDKEDLQCLGWYQKEKLRLLNQILATLEKLVPVEPTKDVTLYTSNIEYAIGTNISTADGIVTIVEKFPFDGVFRYHVKSLYKGGYSSF